MKLFNNRRDMDKNFGLMVESDRGRGSFVDSFLYADDLPLLLSNLLISRSSLERIARHQYALAYEQEVNKDFYEEHHITDEKKLDEKAENSVFMTTFVTVGLIAATALCVLSIYAFSAPAIPIAISVAVGAILGGIFGNAADAQADSLRGKAKYEASQDIRYRKLLNERDNEFQQEKMSDFRSRVSANRAADPEYHDIGRAHS